MEEITLQSLLEAGCHFGHKSERWNPRAAEFIYTEKDGIHIIDLVKTKAGLEEAMEFVRSLVAGGGSVLFVGTKRQAKGIIREAAESVGAPYFSERWIGGFLTNWEEIKKNIQKINRLDSEQDAGEWKKFPKHEQVKLARYLHRLKSYYAGVLNVTHVPEAIFVVDVRKEVAAVREAARVGIPVIGIVDTNSDPLTVSHAIPANDDAVGSISLIVKYIAQAYGQGKKEYETGLEIQAGKKQPSAADTKKKVPAPEKPAPDQEPAPEKPSAKKVAAEKTVSGKTEKKPSEKQASEPAKAAKRRRPKKAAA